MTIEDGTPRRSIRATPVADFMGRISDLTSRISTLERAAPLRNASITGGVGLRIYDALGTLKTTLSSAGVTAPQVYSAGDVSAAGTVSATNVRAAAAPTTSITSTRVAAWLQSSDGTLGTASSSRRYKSNIVDADVDPAAVLSVVVKHFHYTAELRKRDDPTFDEYVGPDYHVATEVGVIAEDLHAAGLWQFVVYQHAPDGALVLDDDGEPIPDGVHYELLGLAVLPAVQALSGQLDTLAATLQTQAEQIATLQAAVTAQGGTN